MNRPLFYQTKFLMNDKVYTVVEDCGQNGICATDPTDRFITIPEAEFVQKATELLNFEGIYRLYQEQYKKSGEAWKQYRESGSKEPYTGFEIDYDKIGNLILLAIRRTFGFTKEQADFIYGRIYERYHSCFEDVVTQAESVAQEFKDFLDIKA